MARKTGRNARAHQRLRTLGWIVVTLAVIHATQVPTTTAPGGPGLGFVLAGLLATYLRATRNT